MELVVARGTLTNVAVAGNSSTVKTTEGDALVVGGLIVFDFSGDPKPVFLRDSVVSGNTAFATSSAGAAITQGAGIYN